MCLVVQVAAELNFFWVVTYQHYGVPLYITRVNPIIDWDGGGVGCFVAFLKRFPIAAKVFQNCAHAFGRNLLGISEELFFQNLLGISEGLFFQE